MKINLGAGQDKLPGFVNTDRSLALFKNGYTDVVVDCDKDPWPLSSDSAELIRAFDVFEHVEDPILFMRECHRILKDGGILDIHTSHWKTENSYTDPTHKRFCTERTFDYWIAGTEYNLRYGVAYAEGRHFSKQMIERDGQELHVVLKKIATLPEDFEIENVKAGQ